MNDYILSTIILSAWCYDNLLLIRIGNKIKKSLINIIYNATETYHTLNFDNEMIKPGYHIDEVYLTFYPNNRIISYDITRIFRKEILKGTFLKGINIIDFIKKCTMPNSNFENYNETEYSTLSIVYTYNFETYKIFFDTIDNKMVLFPLYSESYLKNESIDISKYGVSFGYISRDSESEDGIDITQHLKEAAGPLGDFYQNLPKNNEIKINKKYVIPKIQEDDYIIIYNTLGQKFVFKPEDKFLSFDKN